MSNPKKSTKAKEKYRKLDKPSRWRKHDTYILGAHYDKLITRSQTAFYRVKNTISDMELFADSSRHQPPGKPHLMEVMKGKYGSIPRTIITEQHLSVSNDLCKKLDTYKTYKPEKDSEETEKEPTPPAKKEPKESARKTSKIGSIFGNLFAKKSASMKTDVKTPSKETYADEKTSSIETTADEKTPSKEKAADEKTPSKETAADEKRPSIETAAGVKTPSKEAATDLKTPSKEIVADAKTPSKEATADVKTPSKEKTAEELLPTT